MRNVLALCLAVLAAATLPGDEAVAQSPVYAGLSVERVGLTFPDQIATRFTDTATPLPAVSLGYPLGRDQWIEVTVGYLHVRRTEAGWSPASGRPAPLTVGLRAYPVGASWVRVVPKSGSLLHPFIKLGPDWIPITDSFVSDTPEERVHSSSFGAHAVIGVDLQVMGAASVSLSAGYRLMGNPASRPATAVKLNGWNVGAGITIGR